MASSLLEIIISGRITYGHLKGFLYTALDKNNKLLTENAKEKACAVRA